MDKIEDTLKQLETRIQDIQSQKLRQVEFDKESKQRFQNNLNAFEKYFPKLHSQIKNYKPRNDFKVIASPSGYGNFIPSDSKIPLYGDNPYEQSEEQVKRYTESASFGRSELYSTVNEGTKSDKRLHVKYMVDLAQNFIDANLSHEKKLTSLPEHYPTCMMFGVGLGYAVSILVERYSFDYVFICEPDFESFYASLFCTDWVSILEKSDVQSGCLFLQVGVTYETFFDELKYIVDNFGPSSLISSFCYQHTPGKQINALIEEFFEQFSLLQLGYGFYNDAVTGLAHTIENVNENHCPVLLPEEAKKTGFKDLTAYVVANGPSLDEAIEVLKENQDNVIIFAAGTALNTLIKIGIKPDFHVLVERPKTTYDYLVETIDLAKLQDLNLLAVDVMYPEVPPLYKWSGISLKGPEAGSLLSQNTFYTTQHRFLPALPNCGPLVANTALSFAATFGFGEIYLFGVDNGYPITGPTHSKFSIYNEEDHNEAFTINTSGATHRLEGNLGGEVRALSLMVQAKQQMESLIKNTPKTQYYNVGAGAKIKKATPLEAEDVLNTPHIRDKREVVEKIKTEFFTEMHFSEPEKLVGIEEFESLCDYLIEIAERPYSTRKEASDLLKAQSRVVYAYRGRKYGHLYHVMKGSMLYFHCPLISLLYLYADEEKTLQWFETSLNIWKDCIKAMKKDYRTAWNKRCDYSLEMETMQRQLNGEI
ncbi:DUF115 domain-containing protein [Alteromonas sp. D210916BOD_24]|uniref:motility associated factor glycosyltransferase family protein n=1 Tax=Alteromonas sp. D210916BOD_24 TaxID=3157618 RepID=UPI00399D4BE6